jgi:hypothetical protein
VPKGRPVLSSNCIVTLTTKRSEAIAVVHHGQPKSPQATDSGGFQVSCPSSTTCVLAGDGALQWVVNGKPAGSTEVDGMDSLTGLACTSTTSCLVVGQSFANYSYVSRFALVHKGHTAKAHHIAGFARPMGVSCETSTKCVAVGSTSSGSDGHGVVVAITKGVAGKVHRVAGTAIVAGVSCGSATRCYAGTESYSTGKAESGLLAINKGKPGRLRATSYVGVACWSGSDCLGLGARGAMAWLHNGVVKSHSVTGGLVTLSGYVCPTSARCLLAGTDRHGNEGVMLVTP